MDNLILTSNINKDKYTNYVCEKYDIQDYEKSETIIPIVNFNDLDKIEWNIALVVGNSGSGKSTLLKSIREPKNASYDYSKSCISQFDNISESEICDVFHGVGLSSIPTWLRKPNELSNGEKARLDLAYYIITTPINEWIMIDEYSSVVNRSCAMSMSYAFQRYIRKHNRKALLFSCHFDIIDWLNPDVIFNLNKQKDGIVETEHLIYENSKEYAKMKTISENEVLSENIEIK